MPTEPVEAEFKDVEKLLTQPEPLYEPSEAVTDLEELD